MICAACEREFEPKTKGDSYLTVYVAGAIVLRVAHGCPACAASLTKTVQDWLKSRVKA